LAGIDGAVTTSLEGALVTNDHNESSGEPTRSATVSVYQNSAHVLGILQQLVNLGVLTSEELESTQQLKEQIEKGRSLAASIDAGADVPFFAKLGLTAKASNDKRETEEETNDRIVRQTYAYSEAYYLHVVTSLLRTGRRIKDVASKSDAATLTPGDFVEFRATFRPDEISAILDVVTPDLVAAIFEAKVRSEMIRLFDGCETHEQRQTLVAKYEAKAQMQADLARSIVEAVRVDFRSDATREYYGAIGDGEDRVTAVVVCESDQFLVADRDRLLDGEFTVLGKVSRGVQNDMPLLERNKLLYRLNPTVVDGAFTELENSAKSSVAEGESDFLRNLDQEVERIGLFDAKLSARLEGSSFKVIPIAIYL
jgi:hypothetical protein